jgi:hypothetical protein
MEAMEAAKIWLLSGGAAILGSSLLGVGMLLPMQPWGAGLGKGKVSMKQLGAAHLDWLMLGLMQGLAAGLVVAFGVEAPGSAVWALVVGGWMNPLPYVFRAFGVNAFSLSGPPTQRVAASLGLLSSVALIYGWSRLLWRCWGAL